MDKDLAKAAQDWVKSPEGQQAVQEGAQMAAKMSMELRKAQVVDVGKLLRPMTI